MKLDTFTKYICAFIIGLILGILLGVRYYKETTSKSEIKETVDSLINVNNKIKIKIEQLDSIKDAKVIEVSTLDNDSTLKLFYKLVKE